MKCDRYARLIDDLVEGELDEQTTEQVSLHVLACSSCAAQFELLEREKELYAHFLFEVEPPNNLSVRFQKKLEIFAKPTISPVNSTFARVIPISKMLNSLRLNPVLTTAAVLFLGIGGFGFISLINEGQINHQVIHAQQSHLMVPQTLTTKRRLILVRSEEGEKVADYMERPVTVSGPNVSKQTTVIHKTPANRKSSSKILALTDEEREQITMIRSLEIDTAKQIEKVELLLRSFRNARPIEGSGIYDIAYEKQQAQKLLQNNFELRQKADTYKNLFTEEMLSRVEPYLLDIANLDASSEQVLQIKERVRNQNIIASLQGY